MVKKIIISLFLLPGYLYAAQLDELPDTTRQDFPVGCSTSQKPDLIVTQEFIQASSQMLAHIMALTLAAENPLIVNAHLVAIANIVSHCLQSIGAHHGFKYGLFAQLASLYPRNSKKPHNAMAEIDLIIKQTQPARDDKVAQFVLHAFADIMHNFATIVGNSSNPDIVAHHVSRILTGIVHIAKEAITKKLWSIPLDSQQQFHDMLLTHAQNFQLLT